MLFRSQPGFINKVPYNFLEVNMQGIQVWHLREVVNTTYNLWDYGYIIDSTLGLRCSSFGYQYSEIVRSLMIFMQRYTGLGLNTFLISAVIS